jgi:hypothetical protein
MSHEDFQALAAGYGLHALEPDEEQRLALHLLGCVSCSRFVADTATIGAAFAGMLEPIPPPAGLRARILAAAAAEQIESVAKAEPATASPGLDRRWVEPDPPQRSSRSAHGTPTRGGFHQMSRWFRSRITVGVMAALVGVGVAVPVTLAAADPHTTSNASSTLAQLLLNPQAREITMRGTAQNAVAKAVLTEHGMYLIAAGLAVNNPSDSTYVMWVVDKQGHPHPVATFDVHNATTPQLTAATRPLNRAKIRQLVVSYEPGRKAPARPSKIELIGSAT